MVSPYKKMDPLDSIPSLRSSHVVTWSDYLRIDKEEVSKPSNGKEMESKLLYIWMGRVSVYCVFFCGPINPPASL